MSVFENFELIDNNIVSNTWIEWHHFLIPNEIGPFRETVRILMLLLNHCLLCTNLDGCYFLKSKMPKLPQHVKCDCTILEKRISDVRSIAKAECDIRKFSEYIFKGAGGKQNLFESWGYSISDSELLKSEFEKQARDNYLKGKYELKSLDLCGQRIAIPISIRGHVFYSGWMVYPNGQIKNTTPFGGWIK